MSRGLMMTISPERRASNTLLQDWCAGITGDVLSIGSGGDIDKQGRHYRDYFPRASRYVTSDIDPAMGCERLIDARWMPEVRDSSFDAVFCSGVLEHVDDCHAAVKECWRVLRPNGLFIVGVPFIQPIHRAPHDFWRFTEFGVQQLLKSFAIVTLKKLGDPAKPYGYWVKAQKLVTSG